MSVDYRCLLLIRVSSTSQAQESDSPEYQTRRGLHVAQTRFGFDPAQVLIWTEVYSGRSEERPKINEALALIKKHKIGCALFLDIDRFTRAGAGNYDRLKRKFHALGCTVFDVKGIIQPESNTLEGSGGNFGGDFAYDWSVYSVSEKAELLEAQMAQDEARKILGRTIPVQIQNAQLGRTNRQAPYGFANTKIIDESGKPQPSKRPLEDEARFVRRIFEGVASGADLEELRDELNQAGYRSRITHKWNADHTRIIGTKGGRELDLRVIREIMQRPVYAGFICEKWTHGLPVLANHEGLVPLELWNLANQKRWKIVEDKDSPSGWRKIDLRKQKQPRPYRRCNQDFPFKNLLRCEACGKSLLASFSRGQYGGRYGYYHCKRDHKNISQRREELHNNLRAFLANLTFTPEITQRFENHLRQVWVGRVGDLNRQLADKNDHIASLRHDADCLFEKIKIAQNPMIVARLEIEYENLFDQIKLLEAKRDEKELSETDANRAIKWAKYLLENLDELIMNADDEGLRSIFWSLVFGEKPSMAEINNRTAQLSPLVRLKDKLQEPKNALVSPEVTSENEIWEELKRWYGLLSLHQCLLSPCLRATR